MPITTTIYRIFLASPGDVSEERQIVRYVVNELNLNFPLKNIKLEVIGWEDSTYPGIGDDAQDVINNQINDDYDIFMGVFWSRLGTPTKRDLSGTKEEFERAYQRYLKSPNDIHILMYFKDAPIQPSKVDMTQISNVQKFQRDIREREKAALTSTFIQVDEFEKLIRNHLSLLLNKLASGLEKPVDSHQSGTSIIISTKPSIHEEDEEHGLYEYVDIAVKDLSKMTPELEKITKQISDLAVRMNKRTDSINLLRGKPQDVIKRETKKIVDSTSNDLDIFNKNVSPIIPIVSDLFNNAMKNFSKAFLIHKNYINNDTERQGMLEGLGTMKMGISIANEASQALRDTIKMLPPLTTKLLKSKTETIKVLSELSAEYTANENVVDDLVKNSF